jgi:hypothetical protein
LCTQKLSFYKASFSCPPRKSNQKEGDPGLPRQPVFCKTCGIPLIVYNSGAAELARFATRPRAQTVLAQPHRYLQTIFGGAQGLRVVVNVHYSIVIIVLNYSD